MPQLKINHEYYHKIKSHITTKEDKKFAKTELVAATNIIKSIDQRAETIMRIAHCIIEEQEDFFIYGVMHLKPLTLSTIAQKTGMHESTVSRSTVNKFISTPSGIFELKYFFSSSLNANQNLSKDVSSTKVKELIRQMIINEPVDRILSEDQIATELKKFNISIARRTVAKYREILGFATSAVRKRLYKIKKNNINT